MYTLYDGFICIWACFMKSPLHGPGEWISKHLPIGHLNGLFRSQNQNQNKGPSGKEIFYRKPIKSRDKSKKLHQAQENSTSKVLIV